MTVQEWCIRQKVSYGSNTSFVIGVKNHKTATQQVATISLNKEEERWFDIYYQFVRTTFLKKPGPENHQMMQTTFALRWQEVVTNSPPVRDILERWPALHLESQVYSEFQRITNQNLPNIFYEELDRHTLRLMTLYRQRASKTGKTSDALADILRIHDLQVEDSDEPDVGDAPVAILTVVSDDTKKPIHFNPIKISIVLESEVMVTNLPRLADAFLGKQTLQATEVFYFSHMA
ncbi:UNVERIFIED_CONTAM: hypothetical protein FKN15_060720 [Acipenser sinensis]